MKVFGRMRKMFVAGLLALSVVACGFASQAMAEEIPKQRLQISPAKVDLNDLKPGETKEFELKVQNTGSEKFSYEVSVTPYSVVGEDYQQDFNTETQYTDIAKWITLSSDSGEVEADHEDIITAKVAVPRDVPAGGQYATIMVRMKNDSSNSSEGTAITAYKQVGSIIFASVAGQTRKEGGVIDNKVPSFMFNPPISVTSTVENKGNVHANATYILQVYPFFGSEEVYTNEDDPMVIAVLPDTRRFNTVSWEGAPHLGIFKVKQTVKFLDDTSVTEKVVFICPLWFLFVVLAIIFLVIFGIVMKVRSKKGE